MHNYRIPFKLLLISIFLCQFAIAQILPVKIYEVEDGLPQSQVLTIIQDSKKLLWIGTQDGIASFDGINFNTYTRKDGLPSNQASTSFLDSKGNLWFGHKYSFISRKIKLSQKFESIKLPTSINSDVVDILEDSSGAIWFATNGSGIFKYDQSGWKSFTKKDGLNNDSTLAICLVDNKLWITSYQSISIMDINKNDSLSFEYITSEDGLPKNKFYDILNDGTGNIWLASTIHGLIKINKEKPHVKPEYFTDNFGLKDLFVQNIYFDHSGKIWAATESSGVIRFDKNGYEIINTENGLPNNSINSIFQDFEGSFWFGGESGLCQYRGKLFELYPVDGKLTDNFVWAFNEDKHGNLWIGTASGLYSYSPLSGKIKKINLKGKGITNGECSVIYKDEKGVFWLSIFGVTLCSFDPETQEFVTYSQFDYMSITAVVPGLKGNLLISTMGNGLINWKPGSFEMKKYTTENGLPSNIITDMKRSKDGTYWIATESGGICSFDGEKFKNYNLDEGLESITVMCLTEDLQGNIWIGTESFGLFKYDGEKFVNFNENNGLSGNDIYSIITDNDGNVWMGTRIGLEKFDPKTESVKYFGKNEGFIAIENNQGAVFKDRKGNLWFGTIKGAVKYNFTEDKINTVKPIVTIEDILLFSQHFPVPPNNEYAYNENHLTFRFFAISYIVPQNIRYQYILEGLDKKWSAESNDRYASYTNLAPGKYTFKVKACNSDGIWNSNSSSFEFEIETPFWRTYWFFLIVLVLASGAVYGLHKKNVYQIEQNNIELDREVKKRTIQLESEKEKVQTAYQSLLESEERYRQLVELSPEAVIVHSEGKIRFVNKSCLTFLGVKKSKDLINEKLINLFHPEFRDAISEELNRIYNKKEKTELSLSKILRFDGTEVDVKIIGAPIIYLGRKSGQMIIRDVSEKIKLEESRSRAQKLESIGILAGGIAHDFNNILTAVLGNISLAKSGLNESDKLYLSLESAENATTQAKKLTNQLLTFSTGGAPFREAANIFEIVKETADFTMRGSKSKCKIEKQNDLWAVDVDPGQMHQVVQNIIINSDEAMPDGGIIKIQLENIHVSEAVSIPLSMGKYVKLRFSDEGIGINKELLQKVFDPFFTTKQRGSGIGLATVFSIIKKHEGHIDIDSVLGKGTTIEIYLPASEKAPEPKIKDNSESGSFNGEKILILDDEKLVIEIAEEILTHLGCKVMITRDGNDTIREYLNAMAMNDLYSILILDLTIPGGKGGKDVIKELLKYDPNVRAIVSSGYSNDPIMSEYEKHGFKAVLPKPYTIESVNKILRDVLYE